MVARGEDDAEVAFRRMVVASMSAPTMKRFSIAASLLIAGNIRREAMAACFVGWIDGTATRILDASTLELGRLVELLRRTAFVELSGTVGDRSRLHAEMLGGTGS